MPVATSVAPVATSLTPVATSLTPVTLVVPVYVGIDVGRTSLDLAASGAGAPPRLPRQIPNTAAGIARLVAALTALVPTLVVLEATGAYHRPLEAALVAAHVPTTVVNPARVAAFRAERGGREKTDAADATLLVAFGATHDATLRRAAPVDPQLAQLRATVTYRDTLVAHKTQLTNRLHAQRFGGDATVTTWLTAELAHLQTHLRAVDAALARLLTAVPEAAVLRQLRGVGPAVAAAVLGYLPRGVWGDAKAAAAYAGVHPRRTQSGQRDGSRLSKQGHAGLRRYLYCAAIVALRDDPALIAVHDRLVARGKHPASARCAVMHKLLRWMMGRLKAYYAAQHAAQPPAAVALAA